MNLAKLLTLSIIISTLSCSSLSKEEGIVLNGKVTNFNQDYFLIYSGTHLFPKNPTVDTAYVDKEGTIKARLTAGESNTYQIPTKKGAISMFLKEGAHNLEFDYNDIQNTAVYGGPLARENQLTITFNKEEVNKITYDLFKNLPESFQESLKTIMEEHRNFWNNANDEKTLDSDFMELQLKQIDFSENNLALNYPMLFQQLKLQSGQAFDPSQFRLPPNFYDKLKTKEANNDSLLFINNPMYVQFLTGYFIQLSINAPLRQQLYPQINLTNSSESDILPMLLDNIITNPRIKKCVFSQYLNVRINKQQDQGDGIEKLVKVYIQNYPEEEKSSLIDNFNKAKEKMSRLDKGTDVPEFTFDKLDGTPLSLKELKGKHLYIDVWATWCRPCIAEIPHLKKLESEFRNSNIEFVSISVDQNKAAWEKMAAENTDCLQLHAASQIAAEFKNHFMINGIPRFILIDKDGKLINANAPRPSSPNIRSVLSQL